MFLVYRFSRTNTVIESGKTKDVTEKCTVLEEWPLPLFKDKNPNFTRQAILHKNIKGIKGIAVSDDEKQMVLYTSTSFYLSTVDQCFQSGSNLPSTKIDSEQKFRGENGD